MIFWAEGSIRSAGITLPGKGSPVRGSFTVMVVPRKSPARMAAVGTVARPPPKMALLLEPS